MLLFYILQNYLAKVAYFSKTYCHILLSGANVATISQAAFITEHRQLKCTSFGSAEWHVRMTFGRNSLTDSKAERRHTY
jgi:hypothetical protein